MVTAKKCYKACRCSLLLARAALWSAHLVVERQQLCGSCWVTSKLSPARAMTHLLAAEESCCQAASDNDLPLRVHCLAEAVLGRRDRPTTLIATHSLGEASLKKSKEKEEQMIQDMQDDI
eukprot:g22519.t1